MNWNSAVITGIFLGVFGIGLDILGNPNNSGLCISCFLENIAGALHLHDNVRMSYMRPEIIGLVIGSFLVALAGKRIRVRGGSSPLRSRHWEPPAPGELALRSLLSSE